MLQEGNKSTNFFHSKALSKKNMNTIKGLFNENNKWIVETNKLERLFCEYFAKKIFSSIHPTQSLLENAIKHIPNKVNANMNDQLNQASTVEEIIVVLN